MPKSKKQKDVKDDEDSEEVIDVEENDKNTKKSKQTKNKIVDAVRDNYTNQLLKTINSSRNIIALYEDDKKVIKIFNSLCSMYLQELAASVSFDVGKKKFRYDDFKESSIGPQRVMQDIRKFYKYHIKKQDDDKRDGEYPNSPKKEKKKSKC